jgi:hypothetical protein|tara:strand:- start:228 stop:356 length:129 start_codon:yes stop_codon:yes gene_type:complete
MKAKDMMQLTDKLDMILSELDDLRTLVIKSTADEYKRSMEEE